MSQLLEDFNQFHRVTCRAITMGEEIAGQSSELLKFTLLNTKISPCLSAIPNFDEIFDSLGKQLPPKRFSGYEDVLKAVVELIFRMGAVARASEEINNALATCKGKSDTYLARIRKNLVTTNVSLQKTLDELRLLYSKKSWKLFKSITALIPDVEAADRVGWWVFDQESAPYVHYEKLPIRVLNSVYSFVSEYPEYQLPEAWSHILAEHGITWSDPGMMGADVDYLDDRCIFALIIGVCNADRFSDGTLGRFFHEGTMLRWLKRLAEMDGI